MRPLASNYNQHMHPAVTHKTESVSGSQAINAENRYRGFGHVMMAEGIRHPDQVSLAKEVGYTSLGAIRAIRYTPGVDIHQTTAAQYGAVIANKEYLERKSHCFEVEAQDALDSKVAQLGHGYESSATSYTNARQAIPSWKGLGSLSIL